jgi:hypothetical protein
LLYEEILHLWQGSNSWTSSRGHAALEEGILGVFCLWGCREDDSMECDAKIKKMVLGWGREINHKDVFQVLHPTIKKGDKLMY